MIGADILLKSLIKENVEVIFGYPGGVVIPIYDVLPKYSKKIKHVLVRNEQGAAMAADGYARASKKVGVCLSTSGPGATNLVSGIANAYLDSVPMVAITGQVATEVGGTDAFQEVDITGITQPITKHNYYVDSVRDLPRVIKEAFYIANSGRPGPVLIDIPVDISKEEVKSFSYPKNINLPGYRPNHTITKDIINKTAKLINQSKRPIILTGHGVVISGAERELKNLAERANIPVITTLLGMGAFPDNHKLNFGMLGMHGMAYANFAVHNADLIMGIGLRFDDRITGRLEEFAKSAKVVHIDIDAAEIGKNTVVDMPILCDAKVALGKINKEVKVKKNIAWFRKIKDWQKKNPIKAFDDKEDKNGQLRAKHVISEIYKQTKGKALVSSDVGQNQMWTAQHYQFSKPNLLSSGGLGCMGYSLPASVGAKFAKPQSEVWALMGDGGFQMNIQELGTIMQENLEVKINVFNNGYLGMVRQWQEMFYNKNYSGTKLLNPDFEKIAQAYGIKFYRSKNLKEARENIRKAKNIKGPVVNEFIIKSEDNVFPMVSPGASLSETMV